MYQALVSWLLSGERMLRKFPIAGAYGSFPLLRVPWLCKPAESFYAPRAALLLGFGSASEASRAPLAHRWGVTQDKAQRPSPPDPVPASTAVFGDRRSPTKGGLLASGVRPPARQCAQGRARLTSWRSPQGTSGALSTHPPLLVFLPRDDDHLPLDEGQLVVVVRLAVINGLHAPHLVLPLRRRNGALAARVE